MDPRDLDERGLLMEILNELQQIRMLLTPSEPVVEAKQQALPEPSLWGMTLDFNESIEDFCRRSQVLDVRKHFRNPVTGGWDVRYFGWHIAGAKEIKK